MRSKVLQELLDETPKDLRLMLKMQAQISMRVKELMEEAGMSQKELAEKMDKKPSELSKWLKPGHNMTLRTMAKLQTALEKPVMQVPRERSFDSKGTVVKSMKTSFRVSRQSKGGVSKKEYTFQGVSNEPLVVKKIA